MRDAWYCKIRPRHNRDANEQQSTVALRPQNFVHQKHGDERGDERDQNRNRYSDDAIAMLAVPEVSRWYRVDVPTASRAKVELSNSNQGPHEV